MNQTILDRIKNGTQLFAIDQQPYLQGFLATSLLHSHVAFGTNVPTSPILTGPAIVDASNVEQTLAGVAQGARWACEPNVRPTRDVAGLHPQSCQGGRPSAEARVAVAAQGNVPWPLNHKQAGPMPRLAGGSTSAAFSAGPRPARSSAWSSFSSSSRSSATTTS